MLTSIYTLITLMPFFILIISIFIITLSIIYKRNHFFVAIISGTSLILVLLSLLWINKIIPIYVTSLIYVNFYSIIYIAMITFSGLCVSILAYFHLRQYFFYPEEFYLLLLLSVSGAIFLVISHHFFSLFVGMELMSLPIIGLMTYAYLHERSIRIALKYIILSMLSSNLMLFGIALIYSICGNLDFSNIKIAFLINNFEDNRILLCGIGLLLISFFFKLSLFPFHFWVPDIYQYTSPLVLSFLTTVSKIAIFGVFIKLFSYFPYHQTKILFFIIEVVAIFSIIFGSLMAVFQTNLKKLFGYSSISHMGYILVTILVINQYAVANEAAIIYLTNYLISSMGIFGILSLLELPNISKDPSFNDFSYYKGLFWKEPILSIAMTIVIFSFLGIPITFGFISKFYILFLSVDRNFLFINFAILINIGLSIYYYLKIIINLYSYNSLHIHNNSFDNFNNKIKFVILSLILIIILFGVFPQIIINIVQVNNQLL